MRRQRKRAEADGLQEASLTEAGSEHDHTEAEVAALRCALRKAPSFWLAGQTLQRLITDTTRYIDTYSRALHEIERRTVHRHIAPAPRRSGTLGHLPDPARVDPWSRSPQTIEQETRTTCVCPSCSGSTTVECGECSGTARVRCGNCWGSGRVQGARNKMKNCPECRGGGKRPCGACRDGRVPCSLCGASGSVFAWLSISQERLEQVVVHPMGAAAHVHAKIKSSRDFDVGSGVWVNRLASDTGPQPPDPNLAAELEPDLNAVSDRVLLSRVQAFSSVVYAFKYEVLFGAGLIEVAGTPPAVARSSNWGPLRVRQIASAATATVAGMASLMLASSYSARHHWYAAYGHETLVAGFGLTGAGLLAASVAGVLLPRRLWALPGVRVPLALASAAALALGLAWRFPGPTAVGAKSAIAEGDLDRARVEADALQMLNVDRRGGGEVLDDLHLLRLKGATLDGRVAALAEGWNSDDRREVALSLVRESVRQRDGELYAAKDAKGLTALLTTVHDVDPALRAEVEAHALLVRAELCIPQKDCRCVIRAVKSLAGVGEYAGEVKRVTDLAVGTFGPALKEYVAAGAVATPGTDPHDRQKALRNGAELAKCYADLAGAPSEPTPAAIETLLVPVDRDVEEADKKAAAIAAVEDAKRRRQEAIDEAKRAQQAAIDSAKQKREEALQRQRAAAEAAQAHAASRQLVCGDGSTSGCLCAGSHRGCCSHHGGVAGCEP